MSYKPRPKENQQPGWSIRGSSYALNPVVEQCTWEKFLLAEGLDESKIKNNSKVQKFVQENWDKFYIPTKVLKMYGMDDEM